jgi:hypothetical protein
MRGSSYAVLARASARREVGKFEASAMPESPAESTGRIFISYRRDETAYPAGWLFDRLAQHFGAGQIFKDVDSIELGDDFVQVITSAVGSCDVLLALIGDQWLTIADAQGRRRLDDPADFVRLEIQAALKRHVRIVPILVDGARMPDADELPPGLTDLARRQALELSPNRFEYDTNRLLRVLDATLAEMRVNDATIAGATRGSDAEQDSTTAEQAARDFRESKSAHSKTLAADQSGPTNSASYASRRRGFRLLVTIGGLLAALLAVYLIIQFVLEKPTAQVSNSTQSSASNEPKQETSASPSRKPTPGSTSSPRSAEKLPSSTAIAKSVVVVPMQRGGENGRALYLIDSNRKIKTVKLRAHSGFNSNPLMQPSRNTILYLNDGALRVMAADSSGDRKLFDRDPGGCERVHHAAWSQSDPKMILIACLVSETKMKLLVVGIDGKLIRRLDTGFHIVNDATLSPDGQTVLYRASSGPDSEVGTLYTLPIIGTGAPKQLIDYPAGTDAEPAWSPDGTKIAFRRRVPNGTLNGNDDIYVVKADGSGAHAVASTPAHDFKPIWSPDGKNLLIASNRKSAAGGPGTTFDLWLTRVKDGKVLARLGLKATQMTRPFWTIR